MFPLSFEPVKTVMTMTKLTMKTRRQILSSRKKNKRRLSAKWNCKDRKGIYILELNIFIFAIVSANNLVWVAWICDNWWKHIMDDLHLQILTWLFLIFHWKTIDWSLYLFIYWCSIWILINISCSSCSNCKTSLNLYVRKSICRWNK